MTRKGLRWMAVACLGGTIGVLAAPSTRGDEDDSSRPPKLVIPAGRHPTSRQEHAPRSASGGSSGWGGMWIGTAGIALALAAFGVLSLTARKFPARGDAGPLKVIGRTSLSPRHTVYLLKAGDRVLLIGAGSQGAPTLLGELPPSDRPIGGAS